jgi:flagellar biosynthetic protein FlhB
MATDSQEKTEEPTARRLNKAREEGQVARSVDLSTAILLFTATVFFTFAGQWMFGRISQMFVSQLAFDRKILDKSELLPTHFGQAMLDAFWLVLPFMALLYVLALLAPGLAGGYIFSPKLMLPKWNKLDPIKGLGRMFGLRALIELTKSLLKFLLIAAILWFTVNANIEDLVTLNRMDLNTGIKHAGQIIIDACFWMSMGLVLIALADVPLQKYQVNKQLKMSIQEIKDEMKDAEGRPEVRQQIRRRQREMANNRMMSNVKDADVVITNPSHFAVALVYDPTGDGAPSLVAKGTDDLARRIREEAEAHQVHIFEAPELARALYFTTQLDQSIPEALYHAVAQVIAYVFNLNQSYAGARGLTKPKPVVPDNMRFDENGFLFT